MGRYTDLFKDITNEVKTKNNTILLIDGMNTFLRSFTMINHINENAHHIGALTGFLKSIGYAIKTLSPTRVIIVFDGVGSSNARKNLFPHYKANRGIKRITNYPIFASLEEEKISIEQQMLRLIAYLQCLPLDMLCIDGLEADDVIGYLVTDFETKNDIKNVFIMSSDQDFIQLISDKVQIYSPTKKKIYNKTLVKKEYNVSCNNFIIMKCLLGDNGDNIPGIPGLGPSKLKKYYPELIEDNPIKLDDIFIMTENILNNTTYTKKNLNERIIYDKVLEQKHQLIINNRLMNLKEISLSDENEIIINNCINNPNSNLEKRSFLTMYYSDKLAESIPGVENWIELVFKYLSTFK